MRASQPVVNTAQFPPRLLITGALIAAAGCASWWLMARAAAPCDTLASLTVLATLSCFLISVCFRQMGRYVARTSRWFLVGCMLLAAATLFTDFRFVRRNRDFCEQIRQTVPAAPQNP